MMFCHTRYVFRLFLFVALVLFKDASGGASKHSSVRLARPMATRRRGASTSSEKRNSCTMMSSLSATRERNVISNDIGSSQPRQPILNSKDKAWPPFPFNLLSRGKGQPSSANGDRTIATTKPPNLLPSGADLFFKYIITRGKIGVRQVQSITSSLVIHLPPAAPPLVLLALLPVPEQQAAASGILHKFAKRLALTSLGVSIISWADYELRKKKRLTPLPLKLFNMKITTTTDEWATVLPPFLPEAVVVDVLPTVSTTTTTPTGIALQDQINSNYTCSINISSISIQSLQLFQKWQQQILQTTQNAPKTFSDTCEEWQRLRTIKRNERSEKKRNDIYDQLVAFQKIKRTKPWLVAVPGEESSSIGSISSSPLGWALVTGASKGIGRALAVELARWEIPLVLVARDLDKLKLLATELEQCYGIPCCVLQADLTKPGIETRIHQTTKDAGIDVDILVNNAGLSYCGNLVDTDMDTLERVMQLNSRVVTCLSKLYGKDMKDKRRGRILFVSSVTGAFPGVPGSAVYAASKAYQRSLATSLAKELESHGVGVTCLLPGAVRGTEFGHESNMKNALCWKYPFYSRTAQEVASRGIHALLSGDTEVTPGLINRVWLKIFQPVLPQRISTIVSEVSWKPFHFGFPQLFPSLVAKNNSDLQMISPSGSSTTSPTAKCNKRVLTHSTPNTPMILTLEPIPAVEDPRVDESEELESSSTPLQFDKRQHNDDVAPTEDPEATVNGK